MRILFVGDVVGKPGRQALAQLLPNLRGELSADLVIVNGENSAGGMGITRETGTEMLRAGADVITLGNHVWAKRDSYGYLDEESRIVRPANYPNGAPGRGWSVFQTDRGDKVGVINLCGRVFMDPLENPFTIFDRVVETLAGQTAVIVVDFHAEATSEKVAFGWYADGRASAVVGTHTHIQTADERVLPHGTAYITDVGMTGPVDSVIGVKTELIIERFLTQMPNKFEIAEGDTILSAVVMDIDAASGKAIRIERIRKNLTNPHYSRTT